MSNSKRLLSKAELGLTSIASKEELRHWNRIHITEKYTEATDGNCLVRVKKDTMDPADYPVAGIPGHEFEKDVDIQIPIDSLKNFKGPAKSKMPILEYACVSANEKETFISSTDLHSLNSVTIPGSVQDDTYPDVEATIPRFEPDAIKFGINARLLEKVVDYATKHGNKTMVGMTWTIPKDYDGKGPIQIEFKTEAGQEVLALVMPCEF